jgi:hypothetical protein
MKSVLHATDIYSAVWPLHLMSRIFGLAPYSLKPDSGSAKNGTIVICFCRMWSIFWIILLAVLEYIFTNKNITSNLTLKQIIVELAFSASMLCYSISSLLLSLTINRHRVPEILAKFSEIDRRFSTKKYRGQIYKNTRLFIIVQIAVVTCTLVTLLSYGTYVIHGNFSLRNFEYIFFQILPMLLNCIAILHFVNLVLLLRDKYKYLNYVLENSAVIPSNVTSLNHLNTDYMTPIENYKLEIGDIITESREINNSSRREQFHNLRIIYNQLHDVAILINSSSGFSLLCATFWVFIGIISCVNHIIKLKHADHIYVIVSVGWSSFCMALMTMMAVCCSLAVNECNRSPVIVQKIMLRDDIDGEVTKELEKMFAQFKVMKIGFSACGMYMIDLSFLCGIIGATLSYLVVVSQL